MTDACIAGNDDHTVSARAYVIGALIALCAEFLGLACPALAWGPDGHRIVASMAETQLDDSVRAHVARLLAASGARSLADVSNWADDVREDPAQAVLSRQTSRMHYINFTDASCQFVADSICANGQCVVAAIGHYAEILGNHQLSHARRAQALRFVVHFVGDVHQPLHAGYRPDKGGNTFQVRIDGKGSSLHAIWDSRIIGSRQISWQEYATQLSRKPALVADGDARAWAQQSCLITRDGVYPSSRIITPAYLDSQRDTVDLQLQRAATRLASLLNEALE